MQSVSPAVSVTVHFYALYKLHSLELHYIYKPHKDFRLAPVPKMLLHSWQPQIPSTLKN